LIVLIRPTVLDDPEEAHAMALKEEAGMPGIDNARHNEKYLEQKFRHLLETRKKQRESEMLKFPKPAVDEKDGNPNGRLIPPLPNNN